MVNGKADINVSPYCVFQRVVTDKSSHPLDFSAVICGTIAILSRQM
jgi:hypothetical protein